MTSSPQLQVHKIHHHPHHESHRKELLTNITNQLNTKFELEIIPSDGNSGWKRLEQGNKAWSACDLGTFIKHLVHEIKPELRIQLVNQQHPYAIIVTCSDSRICPELIFDEGIGMLFVIRVAGNVMDPHVMGSIEYAVEHLNTPLLVIMGHQHCGAVAAAMDWVAKPTKLEGNIPSLINFIAHSVEKVKAEKRLDPDREKALDSCVQENVKYSHESLLKLSNIVSKKVESGALKIVLCEYYLTDSTVKVIA